ncbi:MAG: ABC transporter permease [Oscillospiraceae bacterium]|nr:ABC transporter permease [Oscillospiraceae bacterium]
MKSNILTIMKKELIRFFSDKRMVITVLLFPGLMIFLMYSFMGDAMTNMYTVDEGYTSSICVVNLPKSIEYIASESGITLTSIDNSELEANKEKLKQKEIDICVVFPSNFDSAVSLYSASSEEPAPNVEIFYNTTSTKSQSAYDSMTSLLDTYENMMINKFDINKTDTIYDVASEKDAAGSIFASMMPMLLMMFLFSGCMSIAPESIAGEKERGTIATLLVTPIKRSELAIGKIFALAIIALLSGISSTIGTLLSLPKLMGAATDSLSTNVYATTDYLLLGVVIMSTVLLLITLISIISTFAKTVKEATTAVMPLMIIVMLIGITAMFGDGAKTEMYFYLIPLYNTVQSMTGIFSFELVPVNILVSVVSNLIYTGIGTFVLTKMFNSEQIIFTK